jgi:hypothetical protein
VKDRMIKKRCVLKTPTGEIGATISLTKSFCDEAETELQKAACLLHMIDALPDYKFTMREVSE